MSPLVPEPATSSHSGARIVLKARPTARQLADRLRSPAPEGLEIYLDASDITADDWLSRLLSVWDVQPWPTDFTTLVEGPIRSLDGTFFDLTVDSDANRLTIDRLTTFGKRIGAEAACIHLIAPTYDLSGTSTEAGLQLVEESVPLTRYYVDKCNNAGLVPTVENIPPVARMRESLLMTSTIGGPPEHLAHLAKCVPGLRFTFDTSHAALFLNAVNGEDGGDQKLRSLVRALAESSDTRTMDNYIDVLDGLIETVHVSDAEGILGEGLAYGSGGIDLDHTVDRLIHSVRWIVTEVLEPDVDQSPNMRFAADRIVERRALSTAVLQA